MDEIIINGIDVSESVSSATNNNICYSQKVVDELQNNIKHLQEENKELKEKNSQKSNLIWYIYHCSKIEIIQRILYEYYECINDDRYNKERVKKFWDDIFHLQPRRKYKSKYKQTFEEIREILSKNDFDYMSEITNKIIEKINQVL